MRICNKCSEETVKIEGLDFCHNCNKIVETETKIVFSLRESKIDFAVTFFTTTMNGKIKISLYS